MLEPAPAAAPALARVPGAKPAQPSQGAAVYTFEEAAHCPYCRHAIRTVRVLRLSRTQVAFTSTLPRGGRAIVCPDCNGLLSVELTGIP